MGELEAAFRREEQRQLLEFKRQTAPAVVEFCREQARLGLLGPAEALLCQERAGLLEEPETFPVRGIPGTFRLEAATEETGIPPDVLEDLVGIFGRATRQTDPTPPTPTEARFFAEEFFPRVPQVTPTALRPAAGLSGAAETASPSFGPTIVEFFLQLLALFAEKKAREAQEAEEERQRFSGVLRRRQARDRLREPRTEILETVDYTYYGKLA